MKYVQHEGDHLKYLIVEPNGFDKQARYPMVVLLHGFGAHMRDLAGLASAIDSRGYVYAFPMLMGYRFGYATFLQPESPPMQVQ